MKIYKYAMLFAAALGLTVSMSSCDDDSAKGAGDATIGFAQATYKIKESAGLTKIPVAFTGEPKEYPIVFNVEATITGGDVTEMEQLIHFIQLDGLRYAGIENAPAYIEFEVRDNEEINESRFVTLTITSASGAEIVNGTTVIELADNDNNPYEKLWGNWEFTGKSVSDNSAASFEVNISGGFTDEDIEKNADKKLVMWGYNGYKNTYNAEPKNQPVWYVNYDAETESLSIQMGTMLANVFSFGIDGYSSFELKTASLLVTDENAGFSESQQIRGTWSEDLNTITFDPDYALCAIIYGDGAYTNYYWAGFYQIVMTRK